MAKSQTYHEFADTMRIVISKHIPAKGFMAMNICGILFVRREYADRIGAVTMSHEYIHSEQMKELLYLFFYIIYIAEYIFHFLKFWNLKKAYRSISFEREAFQHERDFNYLRTRKHFAQWRKG